MTLINCKSGPLAFFTPAIKWELHNFSLGCSSCLLDQEIEYNPTMGSKEYGLNLGVQLFSHTSGDPFGPMAVKNFYEARNMKDMCIFLYVCLEFGAVWLTATEGCSTKEVISSLISLECNYNCKIRVLSVDAGTNLLEKNVTLLVILTEKNQNWKLET